MSIAWLLGLLIPKSIREPQVAYAQTPPAAFYGRGLEPGDRVEAQLAGLSCGTAVVNAKGEWAILIQSTAACRPTEGATVTFLLNGIEAPVRAIWRGGGLPEDVEYGIDLRAPRA